MAATEAFEISRVSYAVTNIDAMVVFYSAVFQTEFKTLHWGDQTLYQGKLLGHPTLFCPNSIAGVKAEQSRIQFDVLTNDLDGVIKRAAESGGTVREQSEAGAAERYCTVVDPDGNTINFYARK